MTWLRRARRPFALRVPDDVHAMGFAARQETPGPALAGLLAKAGGNPLWVVEILRSLEDDDWLSRVSGSPVKRPSNRSSRLRWANSSSAGCAICLRSRSRC